MSTCRSNPNNHIAIVVDQRNLTDQDRSLTYIIHHSPASGIEEDEIEIDEVEGSAVR